MKLKDAQDVFDGNKLLRDIPQLSMGEGLMLMMGACVDENEDIICLTCNLPNECCKCQSEGT